ncbi:hypothetical protein ACU635_42025 [[Actinomadura] parvosata]|uniref:hypothetical protein n=1 Tax=[Actinomadura] parvosata TaxID=1955412 RepID=UPI00406C41D9
MSESRTGPATAGPDSSSIISLAMVDSACAARTGGEGVAAFQEVGHRAGPPPAITVHVVAGPGPGFLVEVDAVAVG